MFGVFAILLASHAFATLLSENEAVVEHVVEFGLALDQLVLHFADHERPLGLGRGRSIEFERRRCFDHAGLFHARIQLVQLEFDSGQRVVRLDRRRYGVVGEIRVKMIRVGAQNSATASFLSL